jgi:MFS family permease/DNA-binding MarR family transcriptional regulator
MFGNRSILIEPARPEVIRQNPRAPWLAVGVVCFGAFMGQLDASIVTLTFRPMERQFAVPLAGVQWVSLAYLLALVALLTPVGRLSDAVGRKLIYTYGFVLFTLASVACGLAPSLVLLVVFRIMQAAGAAMLQSNSVALVATSAPPGATRLALGTQAAAQAVGLALGPTLGGVLTASVGWRYVYWVNVPVGIAAVVAGRYLLPRTRQFSRTDSFDWLGTGLLAAATTALLLAVSAAAGLNMAGWAAGLLAAVSVLAAAGFAVRQLRARFPLIPTSLLRSARLAFGLVGALAGYLVLFGPLVLVPQVLGGQGAAGTDGAVRAGLILSALPVGFGVAALGAEAVLPKSWGNWQRGAVGGLTCAAALAGLIAMPGSTAALAVLLGVAGLGLGAFVPANNTVIMGASPGASAGVLGGLVNMARGIGTALGICAVTLALHLSAPAAGGSGGLDARPALAMLAVIAVAAALTALAGRRRTAPARRGGRRVTGSRKGSSQVDSADDTKRDPPGPDSAGPDPAGTELADVVSRLRRAMRRAARAADPASNLSVAQLELLSCVAERPGIRPGQLAEQLRLAPSSVATLVNGLRGMDLITRVTGTGDRRTASLRLTPTGDSAVTSWKSLNEGLLRSALASLPSESGQTVRTALPALRELVGAVDALADESRQPRAAEGS